MKVSFFQFLPKFNEIDRNLELFKNILEKNKAEILKTKLLVLPEYFLSGPVNINFIKEYEKKLQEVNIISEFGSISKQFKNLVIVFGSMLFKDNGVYKNTSYVYKNGEIINKYSKKALIYNENYICKSDGRYPVVQVDNKRIGIAICWDLILPEVFRKYTNKADLVIIPSFWGIGGNPLQEKYKFSLEKKYYRELCVARAYENSIAILFVNSVGKYNSPFYSDRMMGGSLAVIPPLGITYFTNSKKADNLHIAEFDFDKLDQYREYYATDRDFKYYKSKNIF